MTRLEQRPRCCHAGPSRPRELHLIAPLSRRQLLANGLSLATAGRASAALSAAPLPPMVDMSALFGPVRNQGDRNTCAYFAATAAAEAALARKTGMAVALSEQYLTDIAHAGHRLPADETTNIHGVLDLIANDGMVPAAARPYRSQAPAGQLVQGPDPALLAIGRRLAFAPLQIPDTRLETLQRRLLRTPLIVALAYPHNRAGWRDDGLVEPVPGLVPHGDARDQFPNHFVVLTGFDRRRQLFFLRSSWGPDWGRGGYGRIRFASMQTNWLTGPALFLRYSPPPPRRDRLPLGAGGPAG
ncbi:hypothetical protein CAP39_07405 [Sphingomonas sp. IBVSS1]|nr:hypothetical protein CAP39_07405 [Sphingomonas sp. IBVSS1]